MPPDVAHGLRGEPLVGRELPVAGQLVALLASTAVAVSLLGAAVSAQPAAAAAPGDEVIG